MAAISIASPSISESTVPFWKPIALRTAISVVRSRIDMAMPLAATSVSEIVTKTAMNRMKFWMLPIIFTNICEKAFSVCVLVGLGELA